MEKDTPLPRFEFEATADGACLVRPGVVPHQHFSRETAARFYRQLQEIVAPSDRRILDAAKEIVGALNENQAAARHLDLYPNVLPGPLLQIARWAREYREPKTGRSPQAAVSDVLAAAEHDDGCTSLISGASLGTCDCRIRDQILASLPWELAVVDPDGSVEEIAAEFLRAGGLMGGSLDSLAEEFARRVSALGGKPKDPPAIVGPGAESEPDPELLERIDEALSTWRASIGPARLTGTGWSLADLLEKAFTGPPQPPAAQAVIREATESQVDGLANHIAEVVGGAPPPLDPHELAALREAVSHARCRLPDLVEAERSRLGDRLFLAEVALRKLVTADDPGPEPRTLKCRHGRPIDVECEECEAEDEPNGPPAVKTSPAVKITKDLLSIKERVAALERRATSNWNATRDTGSALCKRVEALESDAKDLKTARGVSRKARSRRFIDAELRLERIEKRPADLQGFRELIAAEAEKAVAPIRESVHEQLDKVLKAMEKTKDRVDGMLKAADLEPLKLLAVDHDDHEARLMAIEAKWEEVLGARWRAEVAEQLCAMAELDEMEDAEEQPRDRRVTTPPRPEKDVSSQEED